MIEMHCDSKNDAESVLKQLSEIIRIYGQASLADLKDLCALPSDAQNTEVGWTNTDGAHIEASVVGYVIKLPKTIPLK